MRTEKAREQARTGSAPVLGRQDARQYPAARPLVDVQICGWPVSGVCETFHPTFRLTCQKTLFQFSYSLLKSMLSENVPSNKRGEK